MAISKTPELDKTFQTLARTCCTPRADVVKDDSGSYAVVTEQGSSASHMTAAKVLDVISRLPGCAGRASDTVSAYTQVKMKGGPKAVGITSTRVPCYLRSCTTIPPPEIQDPVVPLERHVYGHPLAGLLWELNEHGKNCKLRMFVHAPRKRLVSLRLCGRLKKWRERRAI